MKRLKAVAASVMVCTMLFSFTGCSSFKVIDDEDVFFDALEKTVNVDKDDTLHEKNFDINGDKAEYLIFDVEGDNYYTYIRFKDEDDALDFFDEINQDFDDILDDKEFEGSHTSSMTKTRGYLVFDGEVEGENNMHFYHMNQRFFEDTEIFGGVYVNKNVYIEVYSTNGSKRDKEKVTKLLKELGFPKP